MSSDRKQPGVAFWATVVVVVVLVAYPLSFGLACWMICRPGQVVVNAPRIYLPVGWMAKQFPESRDFVRQYLRLWLPSTAQVVAVPCGGRDAIGI